MQDASAVGYSHGLYSSSSTRDLSCFSRSIAAACPHLLIVMFGRGLACPWRAMNRVS